MQAALDLSGAGGVITFRALGAELGSDPTAVYRHFRDKDELVSAVFDRLIEDALRDIDQSGSWREQLRDLAQLTLSACAKHPSIGVEARTVTTRGPGELGAVELILEMFQEAGLDRAQAVRFYAVFSGYLLSVSAAVAANRLAGETLAREYDASWIGDVGRVDPKRYPEAAAARMELAGLTDHDVFLTGVDVLLDAAQVAGAESTAARATTT